MKVLQTKSMQTLVFDPGGLKVCLRASPFLETWRALLCGEIFVRALDETAAFIGKWMTRSHHVAEEVQAIIYAVRIAVETAVSPQPGWFKNVMPSTTARGYLSYGGERMSWSAIEQGV